MTDEEEEELEIYLEDEDNNTIYEELTKTNYLGLYEPLEFFRLFHSQIDFIEKNKNKPSFVIEKLSSLELNTMQKIVIFEYLSNELSIKNDRQSRICTRQLEKLIEELREENKKAEKAEQNAELEKILDHLETLSNYTEKISYVKQAKAQYEKTKTTLIEVSERAFSKKCELIINKCESVVENEQKESKDKFAPTMYHQRVS